MSISASGSKRRYVPPLGLTCFDSWSPRHLMRGRFARKCAGTKDPLSSSLRNAWPRLGRRYFALETTIPTRTCSTPGPARYPSGSIAHAAPRLNTTCAARPGYYDSSSWLPPIYGLGATAGRQKYASLDRFHRTIEVGRQEPALPNPCFVSSVPPVISDTPMGSAIQTGGKLRV